MFMITYRATNKNTYEMKEIVLRQLVSKQKHEVLEEVLKYETLFKELPQDIKNDVIKTDDGVWVPNVDTIRIFKVEEIKN